MGSLGLVIFLGHNMQHCPNAHHGSKGRPFVVAHTNGIHNINIDFCRCNNATDDSDAFQLTAACLFPATVDKPETVFTFAMLKDFHAHTLASKISAYDHFIALKKLTNNAFPDRAPVGVYFKMLHNLTKIILGSLSRISDCRPSMEIFNLCSPSRTGTWH
jgi:hypothetical protein